MKRILLFLVALLVASAFNLTSGQSSGDTGFHPDYLNFTAVNGSASVKLSTVGNNPPSCSFQYSTDDCTTWNNYSIGTQINLASGATVYLKATTNNNSLSSYTSGGAHVGGSYSSIAGYHHFEMMGTIEAHGNTMSLLTSTLTQTSVPAYAFYRLFEFCSSLTTAPSLPASELGEGCYYSMFWGCTALREPPELSATSTVAYCYNYMFYACHNLFYPPALPATVLTEYCYNSMFKGCTLLSVDTTGAGYTWSIPSTANPSASAEDNWGTEMFLNTAGTLQGQPVIGQNYYVLTSRTVTATVNDTTMGSVTGGGSYTVLDTATLTATSKQGHYFVNWSNGATTPTINYVVTQDTSFTANFAVNPSYLFEESDTICQGDTLIWREKSLTAAGVYYDSLLTAAGCDSVYKLTLTVNPKYLIEEADTICQGQTYLWHEKSLTAAGVYYDSLLTAAGCDSVYQLTLTVNPTYFYSDTMTICSEPITWHEQIITTPGTYYDSLLTVSGCDSIYELHVNLERHTVTATANYDAMGSVTGGGVYNCGDTVTVTATAFDHYSFSGWSNGVTDSVITFVVTGDTTITANFVADRHIVNVSIEGAGSVSGGGVYDYGTEATLTAVAADNWKFVCWSNGDSSDVLTFIVVGDTLLQAKFEHISTALDETEAVNYVAYVNYNEIVVTGAAGHAVAVFDMNGKLVGKVEDASDIERIAVNAAGVYIISVENMTATRVVVR